METASPSPLERRVLARFVGRFFFGNRRGGPWLPPAHLRWEPLTFATDAGTKLAGRWFPADRPRGAVVLAHPDRRYGKHWFERVGWIDWLHREGYDVLTFDFSGYGESDRAAPPYQADEVVAAARLAEKWAGGLPVSVVGVSMGSFAAANAAPRLDLDGLVLESPYPRIRDWYGPGAARATVTMLDTLFPRTAQFLRADLNLPKARAKRILVAAAAEDELTPLRLSEAVAAAGPAGRTRKLVVPGAKHLGLFERTEYRDAVREALGA